MSQDYIAVLELTGQFKDAVEAKLQTNPAKLQEVMATVSDEEMENLQDLMAQVVGIAMGFGLGGSMAEVDLKTLTTFYEKFTEIVQRIIPDEELLQDMPEDLKTTKVAALWDEHGAPRLAKLCAPTL